jgi:hypothetical protein
VPYGSRWAAGPRPRTSTSLSTRSPEPRAEGSPAAPPGAPRTRVHRPQQTPRLRARLRRRWAVLLHIGEYCWPWGGGRDVAAEGATSSDPTSSSWRDTVGTPATDSWRTWWSRDATPAPQDRPGNHREAGKHEEGHRLGVAGEFGEASGDQRHHCTPDAKDGHAGHARPRVCRPVRRSARAVPRSSLPSQPSRWVPRDAFWREHRHEVAAFEKRRSR